MAKMTILVFGIEKVGRDPIAKLQTARALFPSLVSEIEGHLLRELASEAGSGHHDDKKV